MKGRLATLAALVVAVAPRAAAAQTMLDQEQRLIDIHSLLLDLGPVGGPGDLAPGEVDLGLEVIGVPPIDGTTGTKRQLTARDHTPLFPRPRLAVGLPAPAGFRAFAGLSYIPPVTLAEVSSHFGGLEAGLAWLPGPWRVGVRAHALYAHSRSPVTDPATRDTLDTLAFGVDLAAAYELGLGPATLTPYAGVGYTHARGDFTVTSDGVELHSRDDALALAGGLRALVWTHWEAVAELELFPGRLVHPSFRVGYVFGAF